MGMFPREAKIGLFFLMVVAVFAYVWFSVLERGIREGFILKAQFKSVEGLVAGAQVQMAGIRIGRVKETRYDPETGRALVLMEIQEGYLNSIPEDSQVMLKTRGLIGDKFVVIVPGKPNVRKLKPNEEFKTAAEPTDTEKTLDSLGVVSQDLEVITREARKQMIADKGFEKLGSMLDNGDVAFKDLRDILGRNKPKINSTVDNSEGAARKLNRMAFRNQPKIDRTVDDMEKFAKNMDQSAIKFGRASNDLEILTRDIRAGKGTLGKMATEETLHQETLALVRQAQGLINAIQNGQGVTGRVINDPELYFETRRAIRNMNKTAEDVSEATPVSTLAIILGSIFR
jgi:phospholipid/cholesterol/gamma-HCH transport system substrate-binding protein